MFALSGLVAAQHRGGNSDRAFLMQSTERRMVELQLGTLAEQVASRSEVKDFARRMEGDQTTVDEQLKAFATAKGVTLPVVLDAKDQALKNRLTGLSRAAFDRSYIGAMVTCLQRDVAAFKGRSVSHDGEIRDFASNTLSTLRGDLKAAWRIRSNLQSMKGP
jgi:putative membrane protein